MNKIYYLSTCSTCARIIKDLKLDPGKMQFQDIKTESITKDQIEKMKKMSGSYESLFSRIALKYKGLDPKPQKETEYKNLILKEYTFLKRPVFLIGDSIFIGNGKKVIENVRQALKK